LVNRVHQALSVSGTNLVGGNQRGEAAVFAAKARNTIAAATQNATGLGSVRNWNRSSLTAVASSRGRA
jgi:hypothetical protein